MQNKKELLYPPSFYVKVRLKREKTDKIDNGL